MVTSKETMLETGSSASVLMNANTSSSSFPGYNDVLEAIMESTGGRKSGEPILQPGPMDVLCGKDATTYAHPGNHRFRALIGAYSERYAKSPSRADRTHLTCSIVAKIMEGGGRFIKKNNRTSVYEHVPVVKAREKVSHALRDVRRFAGGKNAPKDSVEEKYKQEKYVPKSKRATSNKASSAPGRNINLRTGSVSPMSNTMASLMSSIAAPGGGRGGGVSPSSIIGATNSNANKISMSAGPNKTLPYKVGHTTVKSSSKRFHDAPLVAGINLIGGLDEQQRKQQQQEQQDLARRVVSWEQQEQQQHHHQQQQSLSSSLSFARPHQQLPSPLMTTAASGCCSPPMMALPRSFVMPPNNNNDAPTTNNNNNNNNSAFLNAILQENLLLKQKLAEQQAAKDFIKQVITQEMMQQANNNNTTTGSSQGSLSPEEAYARLLIAQHGGRIVGEPSHQQQQDEQHQEQHQHPTTDDSRMKSLTSPTQQSDNTSVDTQMMMQDHHRHDDDKDQQDDDDRSPSAIAPFLLALAENELANMSK